MVMATDVQSKLAAMTVAFLSKLTDKIRELEESAAPIVETASEDAIRHALGAVQALAHRLAGSAGTYGYGNIGHTARNLELTCQALLEHTDLGWQQDLGQVHDLVSLMGEQAKTSTNSAMIPAQRTIQIPDVMVGNISSRKSKNLILVDDDVEQAQFLEQLLTNFGFTIRILEHPSALQQAVLDKRPDAVIMDIMFPDDRDAGLATVDQLRKENVLDCPVIFISVREDFSARLEAIRGGSDGYIVKPIDINELVESLNRLIEEGDRPPFRVLIVDDDEDLTGFCQVVLEGAGIVVCAVNDPLMASEEMIRFGPDVIVLDIEMPNCNGFELASVIRQMGDAYLQIPILYLTSHDEVSNQMRAARTGSEDFITKPVDPDRLVSSIVARSERSRVLKALYQRLRSGEERFSSITRSANEAVVSANALGLVLSWNPSAERIFGYRKREILGKPLTMLVPQKYRQGHLDGFQRFCDGGKPKIIGTTIEVSGLRKDGTEFPLDISLSSWDSDGDLFFAATMRDITERKDTEGALHNAKEEADNANRAKSEFLSSMSHELRTPLNAILGFGQLLQFNPKEPLSKTQNSSVDLIMKGGSHLLELINDILDLARIESGNVEFSIEDIKISAVVEECRDLVADMAEKRGIDIEIDELEGAAGVQADFTRIKQVLLNLLSNAIKYNRDNGKVTIRVEDGSSGLQRISVIDTGNGIADHQMVELFKPFSRLGAESSEIEGTGIGLVVCKQLVESMHGRIGVDSQEGVGSTFWFEIPSSAEGEKQNDVRPAGDTGLADAPAQMPATVDVMGGLMLYVEDNPSNLRLMEMIVSRIEGLTLIAAHNAELGIEMARSKRPDIIFLDINLPGMNGFQALEKLQEYEETRDIPVLALSAAATKRDIEKGIAAGFTRYMTKPMQIKEVIAAINEQLEKFRA